MIMYKKPYKSYNSTCCTNCGEFGHNFKKCNSPITSFGIIAVQIPDNITPDFFNKEKNIDIMNDFEKKSGIICDENDSFKIAISMKNDIKFLLIMRKHTLGYMEFVRGHYNADRVDHINYLFKQMIKQEIEKIKISTFDQLWVDAWSGKHTETPRMYNEYVEAKRKFELINNNVNGMNIKYYTTIAKPTFDQPEWGFPKGRRYTIESELECAIREFEEETNLNAMDYTVLTHIQPLVEDFIGTNGIKYRHKYFVALLHQRKIQLGETNIHQLEEIGQIGTYGIDESLNKIRDYHTTRKKILYATYIYIVNSILTKKNNIITV